MDASNAGCICDIATAILAWQPCLHVRWASSMSIAQAPVLLLFLLVCVCLRTDYLCVYFRMNGMTAQAFAKVAEARRCSRSPPDLAKPTIRMEHQGALLILSLFH